MSNVRVISVAATAAALLWLPSAVDAQEVDARWLPWTGCWQAVDDSSGLLCVELADGGVEFLSVGDEGVVSEETIVADGVARAIDDEVCSGSQSADFAPDGERIYLVEELACGDQLQMVNGVIAMVSPSEWVDIRGSDTGRGVYSRTFRRVSDEFATSRGFPDANNDDDLTARMRRWAVSEPSSLSDIVEVLERTGPGVTRAWVVEQIDPFPVDSEFVIALDEAGVPHDVIDVVVAHAFPGDFALADNRGERRPSDRVSGGREGGYVGVDPWVGYWSPWSWRYRPYGYAYGWDRWGYPYGWPYRERVIVVNRTGGSGGFDRSNGVRPIPGGGYARPDRGSSGGGSQPARVSGGSRSGGSVSSGGVSGGRSTGRTAKPRRTGGGSL